MTHKKKKHDNNTTAYRIAHRRLSILYPLSYGLLLELVV
jgi:hypothetical protein